MSNNAPDQFGRGPVPGSRGLLPLFPLSTVLVPGLVMPMHIFEPRYRRLVADLLEQPEGERRFGVVAIREGIEIGRDGARALHKVGTTAEVDEIDQLPDGRYALLVTGGTRFRVDAVDKSAAPYLTAQVEYLEELPGPSATQLVPRVIKQYRAYREVIAPWTAEESAPTRLTDDPQLLSYLVASTTVLDLSERQALLEEVTTTDRLRRALKLLRRETVITDVLQSLPSTDFARVEINLN